MKFVHQRNQTWHENPWVFPPAGWPDAFAILSSPSDGFPLDVYACGAIIRACEQNGQWGAALEALNYALEVSLKVGPWWVASSVG